VDLAMVITRIKSKSFFVLALIFLILINFSNFSCIFGETSLGDVVTQAINFVNLKNIENNTRFLSSLGTRVPGYPGYYEARDYITNYLKGLGYEVVLHNFTTVSPIDEGSFIALPNGTTFKAYALWPNGLIQTSNTPIQGYCGKLIYVGKGDLKDFDGKDVLGSIVLMDYDSGSNWLNAAKLGAKAVIFIESKEFSRYEALDKFLMTPIKFTRLYVNSSVGQVLKKIANSGGDVKVFSKITLKEVNASNIIARLDGTKMKDQVIVVSARYDSWSVVPSISPAAGEAISISSLLEIARFFSYNRPERSIWIVAFSGHWNALDGPRKFAIDELFKPEIQNGTYKIYTWIGVDIGYESPKISTLYSGYAIRFSSDVMASNYAPIQKVFSSNSYLLYKNSGGVSPIDLLNSLTKNDNYSLDDYISWDIQSNDWWGNQHSPYILDTEPLALLNMLAFTIRTSDQIDYYWGNPQSDYENINFQNVYSQTLTIIAHLTGLTNDESFSVDWKSRKPTTFTALYGYMVGLTTLTGEVAKLNLTSGWYAPVPHALVRVYPEGPSGTAGFPFSYLLLYANEKGEFNVTIGPIYSTPAWRYDAWVFNENDSEIVAAPDMGPLYGQQVTKPSVSPVYGHDHVIIPLFDCDPITLFDVYDPGYFRVPWQLDPRRPFSLLLQENFRVSVLDFKSEAIPYFFGTLYIPWEPVVMFFVRPNSRVSFSLYFETLERPSIILVNSSRNYMEGYGILVNKPLIFNLTSLLYASDLINVVSNRYSKLNKFNVRNPSIDEALSRAIALLNVSKDALGKKNYSVAYNNLRQSLAYVSSTYKQDLMPIYSDSGLTSVLLLFISIPSIVIMERLFIHKEGKERFIYTMAIGVGIFSIFLFIHPAFSVTSNSLMGIIGSLLVLLFSLTLLVLISETSWVLSETAETLLGKHRISKEEVSVLQVAVPTSLEFMRRRKLRSILTAVTMIVVVIGLTSLTSSSYYTAVKYFNYGIIQIPYESPVALVKIGYGMPPFELLDKQTVEYVKGVVGNSGDVLPRAWLYPVYSNRLGHSFSVISKTGKFIKPIALLGLSNLELRGLSKQLNSSLSISNSSNLYCVLTSSQAKDLGVSIGDDVELLGLEVKVAGILPSEKLQNILDITNNPPTPIDPIGISQLAIQIPGQPTSNPPPLSWESIIILPFDLAMNLGGYVGSIKINFKVNDDAAFNITKNLSLQSSLPSYFVLGNNVVQTYKTKTYLLLGMEALPLLIAIAALNITVALLGGVKERTREIYIFASVGLSPRGSAVMFITEAVTFSFLSSIIGYIIGFIMNKFLISFGLLPSNFVINAASLFVGVSLVVVFLSSILASIYPSIVSARLITPSLERRWVPPTKPKGDLWEMPLPIEFPSIEEAKGFLKFLAEYYSGEGKEKAYFIIRSFSIDLSNLALSAEVSLAPFEANISQQVVISVNYDKTVAKGFTTLTTRRTGGTRSTWITSNYNFIDDVRKQVLLWRSLSPEEHETYIRGAK
jgi:ABC-type antimicrobial peptide transport system permease subunit